ncbi:MAG TPA: alanine racemase [Acidimicrobiales bacterium]|nr:alanine racemase [Acidimicrobiales bacterium]
MDWYGPNKDLIGEPGSRDRLGTPALVVDVDMLDKNIKTMANYARTHNFALRPCLKIHKSIEIARRQVAAGAIGLCCATLAEAECLVSAGISSPLIFSPIVTPGKLARLTQLNAMADDLVVVTDSVHHVEDLAAVARDSGATLSVLVDYEMGAGRTGVPRAKDAVALAHRVAGTPGLIFAGLQGYNGAVTANPSFAGRRKEYLAHTTELAEIVGELASDGLAPRIVSGGGTGTHDIDAHLGVFTELQVGTYIFMDVFFDNLQLRDDGARPFETALSVYATVISTASDGFVITDVGAKEIDGYHSQPDPVILSGAPPGSRYSLVGDDLGRIDLPEGFLRPKVGDTVRLMPPRAWEVVPFYTIFHCVSGTELVDIWPIDASATW